MVRSVYPYCQQLEMKISWYTIPPSSDHPFFITAKRYWLSECEEQEAGKLDRDSRVTLILLHSTSFHKEIWEPCIEDFYNVLSKHHSIRNRTKKGCVRDAWAIDCPNHGQSARLNLRRWQSQNERVKCMYNLLFFFFFFSTPFEP